MSDSLSTVHVSDLLIHVDCSCVVHSMPEEDEEFQESSLNDTQGSDSSKIKWTPMSVNSHLHHSRATPTENMADLRLSGSRR